MEVIIKKLNKKITTKLNELILRLYPVSTDDITDEYWALNNKKN
ncbi:MULTISPECIES: hypothetical protein [unclassified Spiroplasma]